MNNVRFGSKGPKVPSRKLLNSMPGLDSIIGDLPVISVIIFANCEFPIKKKMEILHVVYTIILTY